MICKKAVKRFCCEDISLIENYQEAVNSNEKYDCHHKMELIKTGAVVDSARQDLIDWGIYYNRPADELIFLKHAEHTSLHHKDKKMPPRSEETRRKISESHKGRTYGSLSEEHKRRISETMKGIKRSEEFKRKVSEANKGRKLGPRSEETKRKISETLKSKHWKLVDGKRVYY